MLRVVQSPGACASLLLGLLFCLCATNGEARAAEPECTQFVAVKALDGGEAMVIGQEAAGWQCTFGPGTQASVFAAKYDSEGKLVESFGEGGRLNLASGWSPYADYGSSVQLFGLLDGSFLVTSPEQLVRFDETGEVDPQFGSAGLDLFDYGVEVAVGSGGDIALKGSVAGALAVARLKPDGSIDTDFGTGGVAQPDLGVAQTMGVDPVGRVLLGGVKLITTNGWSSNEAAAQVARLNAEGELDPDFGAGGVSTSDTFQIQCGYEVCAPRFSTLVTTSEEILLAGSIISSSYKSECRSGIDASFAVDGGTSTVDPQFGGCGIGVSSGFADGDPIYVGNQATFDDFGNRPPDFSVSRYSLGSTVWTEQFQLAPSMLSLDADHVPARAEIVVAGRLSGSGALIRVASGTGDRNLEFGTRGMALLPATQCAFGSMGYARPDSAVKRCRIAKPFLKLTAKLVRPHKAKPGLVINVSSNPERLLRGLDLVLPKRLGLTKRGLRGNVSVGGPGWQTRTVSAKGRRIHVEEYPTTVPDDIWGLPLPQPVAFNLLVTVGPGALKRIPRRLLGRKLTVKAISKITPLDYDDGESGWFGPNFTTRLARVLIP